ncbi:MAG: alpha/beta hydrolase [Lachnospiraceae bacterium]|nr:alpha/beta hydrolase [Lachnospiraceae bacterium]
MIEKKIAVIFPGIGYHKDKPLLYYATKLALGKGYEVIDITYHDMPQKIRGNETMMKNAAELAFAQSKEQLAKMDFNEYDQVLFIGKSIGTIASAKYASDYEINAKQIWYTPVEATFSYPSKNVVAMIGEEDSWSDVDVVKKLAKKNQIKLFSYAECNHSLESTDVDRNLINLRDVMIKTKEFLEA